MRQENEAEIKGQAYLHADAARLSAVVQHVGSRLGIAGLLRGGQGKLSQLEHLAQAVVVVAAEEEGHAFDTLRTVNES